MVKRIKKSSKVQTRLNDSERSFRLLVAAVTDYALYMLDPTGIITNWNAGGERIKGYSSDEIVGQHFSRFYTESDRASGKPARALATARDAGRYEEEGWRVRKDGSFFWASVIIDPIKDEHGKLIGFAKITRDITERREAQQRYEKIQQQLAESQKFDALGQLTGGVAHDFNNLLMIVTGSLPILRRAAGDDPKLRRVVQAVETATQRGAALTSQLLTFARRQRVNPQLICVADRVNSIREVLNAALGSSSRMVLDVADNSWPVMVDPTEFETALVNLVVNARDAMPASGTVTIEVKNVVLTDNGHQGEYVAVSVKDTGVGIPDDIQRKVFDPFFTTKPVGKGTGLGLSQVYGFAHQAGGTVNLESKLGQGTRVIINLPRGMTATTNQAIVNETPTATGTVLLVEDNPDVATACSGLLEQLGYDVRWAADAEAAWREIDNEGIDMVLSDVVMPGKRDGVDLARAIKAKHPDMPVLLTTGYTDAFREIGSDFQVLRKPYQLHELSRALASLHRLEKAS
jgi:PAS domain S-box-containing protein